MKVLLVDDHDMFRDGLSLFFANEYPACEVLNAKNHQEVGDYIKAGHVFTLVLLDLHLQELGPHQNIQDFVKQFPDLPVCIMSGEEKPELILSIVEYAPLGFIPKVLSHKEFIEALKVVMQGNAFMPDYLRDYKNKVAAKQPNITELTDRQVEVLSLIAKGYKNDAIATTLHVSENTVAVHVRTILKLLNVANRTEAGFVAQRYGLL